MTRDTFDRFSEPERGLFGDNELQERGHARPRVNGQSDLHDLTLTFRHEKPASIAVTDPSKPRLNDGKWIWLAKSQIEFERGRGDTVVVTLPEWLAVEKGLL